MLSSDIAFGAPVTLLLLENTNSGFAAGTGFIPDLGFKLSLHNDWNLDSFSTFEFFYIIELKFKYSRSHLM
jgi:hypothetical protein